MIANADVYAPQINSDMLGQRLPHTVIDFFERKLDREAIRALVVLDAPDVATKPAQDCIFYLHRFNALAEINPFLKAVNTSLRTGGYFVGCAETAQQSRERILATAPTRLRKLYFYATYLTWQLWVRIPGLQRFFYQSSPKRCRPMSKIEAIGRLYAQGFEVDAFMEYAGKSYFVARKVKPPQLEGEACCGFFIGLDRIGQHGKPIHVYKFRTMYPYSEYLLDYVFDHNGLQAGGKIKNDPRVTPVGRVMRKYWLDELPMLLNLFKGQLKLFGVRPISPGYFHHYPPAFQEYRQKFKPGLIPPVYAELPQCIEDVAAIEERYLHAYERAPWQTDWEYARKVLYNIVVKKVRSH
jgi:hypothetical protein